MPISELNTGGFLGRTLSRAWYSSSISDFLSASPDGIVGQLSRNSSFAVEQLQMEAWLAQVQVLKTALYNGETTAVLSGWIFFEFVIPRMGRRIDVVVVTGPIVFAIEFKTGTLQFENSGMEQVWDYALDLKNFHATSHHAAIIPVLIAMGGTTVMQSKFTVDKDNVYRPVQVESSRLRETIQLGLNTVSGESIDGKEWVRGTYLPTPTIIEAARALYAQHSVDDIARHDAGAKNLALTSQRIEDIIDQARSERRKVICFVTGVPGAGKTLVGLNVATQRRKEEAPTHAVFLSGNGPLVDVLREALAMDEFARDRADNLKITKGTCRSRVKAFIQNVHHFRDEGLRDSGAPADHVVIFDEAQRAWNLNQTANFMKQKKRIPDFNMSEPQFLISYLDRHEDWAVVICLVGGGQEINQGEAGIGAWIAAVVDHYPKWDMVISDKLTDSEYAAVEALSQCSAVTSDSSGGVRFDDRLHLSISMRSFRAENVSDFVKLVLDADADGARAQLELMIKRFPLRVSRDLNAAKQWIRDQARGSERFGLVASSKAMRLKPHAVDVRFKIDPVKWFLEDRTDIRSSYYMEDAATEFQVQGLELDWVCVNWDADLRYVDGGWSYHDFKGSRWNRIRDEYRQRYALNAYRVLLTRARQGMVIFVPPGDRDDQTRPPDYYDGTFRFLTGIGIPPV